MKHPAGEWDDTIQCAGGGHDDLVMALMIANLAVSQPRIGYHPGGRIA
jgi:hypothetical protein